MRMTDEDTPHSRYVSTTPSAHNLFFRSLQMGAFGVTIPPRDDPNCARMLMDLSADFVCLSSRRALGSLSPLIFWSVSRSRVQPSVLTNGHPVIHNPISDHCVKLQWSLCRFVRLKPHSSIFCRKFATLLRLVLDTFGRMPSIAQRFRASALSRSSDT